jgi:GNAT superfamily N-acetyltransferase
MGLTPGSFTRPTPILPEHTIMDFDCGEESLNRWLQPSALKSERKSARTYVSCVEARAVAYSCLSAGSIDHLSVPGRIRRNMPNPIPVILLGRIAVDQRYQGHGLGRLMFRDAMLRTARASLEIGIRAMLVHALNEKAMRFYLKAGFLESPIDPMILMLPIEAIQKAVVDSTS